MTTLQPRPPYSPDELAKLYPHELELQQVQILLRHGERSPVSARFKDTGLAADWPYCTAANAMRSVIREADGSWNDLQWTRRLETLGKNDVPTYKVGPKGEVGSICQPGELTDKGRETTLALGERIRKLYVERLGFLPQNLSASSASSVLLRSTPIPRALESVQQAFTGLYPTLTRPPGLPAPTVVIRAMQEENLFPNEGACKRFGELAHAFADRTAKLFNEGPELAYINKKIGKWMPMDSPVVKVDSHPRLSGVMDTVNATLAHGKETRLPSEFYDQKVRDGIDRICVEEWFVGYQESNEYRKLGIGSLIGDITQKLVEHAVPNRSDRGGPFKISLSGCHDTTIAASLTALGAYEVHKDKWPNFTSSIAFELFKHKSASSTTAQNASSGAIWPSREKTWWYSLFSSPKPAQSASARSPLLEWPETDKRKLDYYYVRLRYNDKPVTIPFCKATGRHLDGDETFCTLAAFKEAADSFTPKDWKAECRSGLNEPAMKERIEPPPGL